MSEPRRSASLAKENAQQQVHAGAATSAPTTNQEADEPIKPTNKPPRKPRERDSNEKKNETNPAVQVHESARASKRRADEPLESIEPPKKARINHGQEDEQNERRHISNDECIADDREAPNDRVAPGDELTAAQVQADAPPSVEEEGLHFLEALISVITAQRLLDEKRAAEEKCLTEKSQLHYLLDFTRPTLLRLPATAEHRRKRKKLIADMQRYERRLAQREEREMALKKEIEAATWSLERCKDRLLQSSAVLPDLAFLENSVEFPETFQRCRFHYHVVAGAISEMHELEQEMGILEGRVQEHTKRLAARALDLMKRPASQQPPSVEEADDDEQSFVRDNETYLRLSEQHVRLEFEVEREKQEFSEYKDMLAKIAQTLLEEVGLRFSPAREDPATETERAQQQAPPKKDASKSGDRTSARDMDHESNRLDQEAAQREHLKSELLRAEDQLEKARRDFDHGRRLTSAEAALLTPFTEDNYGANLAFKLSRVTRNLIEAEERLAELRAVVRRAGVIERFPVDQSWGFEDRSDDGYADSIFAGKVERVRWDVEEWLPCLAHPENVLPPEARPVPPKGVPDLGPFDLGEDSADSYPEMRKRIDDYRRDCELLRQTGDFPRSESDKIIAVQQSHHFSSHMI